MKNKSIKYILLSVAITSSLLFTACGNKSETINEAPETTAVEETTTSEETTEEVVEGHTVDLTDTSTTESTSGVDSTGVDVVITAEDGDYQEPTAEEDAAASVPETPINEDYSQYSASTQSSINFLTDMFEKGMFTKEEYKIAVDALISAEQTGGGSSSRRHGHHRQR